MTTFLLIPGAGGMAWYWHLAAERLRTAGHQVLSLELPGEDPDVGLASYIEMALEAGAGHEDLVVAAQSLGGFTAVPVCERVPARALILVNAMIPNPGETAGEWWGRTGAIEAREHAALTSGYSTEFDVRTYFLHDIPAELLIDAPAARGEDDVMFAEPCPFGHWPDVPTTVFAATDDRFFPFAFQQRVAAERLKLPVQALPGGHLTALAHPDAVTRALLRYA